MHTFDAENSNVVLSSVFEREGSGLAGYIIGLILYGWWK